MIDDFPKIFTDYPMPHPPPSREFQKPRYIVMKEDLDEVRNMVAQAQRELQELKDSFDGRPTRKLSGWKARTLISLSLLAAWGGCMYLVWWMCQ